MSEVIIVTMHTLLYAIKASANACFVFSSLTGVQFPNIEASCRRLNFQLVYILAQFK